MAEGVRYTTQLQAGLGLVNETPLLFELYQPGMSSSELFASALASGRFPLVTARRLENIVRECFVPRYLRQQGIADTLKKFIPHLQRDEILQVMLLHTARANAILSDFIREVYWPLYMAGRETLEKDAALQFVKHAIQEGKTQSAWSEGTVDRVASYLLGACTDFGLLAPRRTGPRKLTPPRLQLKVAAYLAYDLKLQGLGDNQLLNHPDWQLFGLEWNDVRDQLKRLSLQGLLILQTAGDVTHISWQYKSMEELIDVLIRY